MVVGDEQPRVGLIDYEHASAEGCPLSDFVALEVSIIKDIVAPKVADDAELLLFTSYLWHIVKAPQYAELCADLFLEDSHKQAFILASKVRLYALANYVKEPEAGLKT